MQARINEQMEQDTEAKEILKQNGKTWNKNSTSYLDDRGKVMVRKFQPSANELISMTPSQKQ